MLDSKVMAPSALSESSSSKSRHDHDVHQVISNLRDATETLRERVSDGSAAEGIIKRERFLHFIQSIEELSPADYRAVVGMLNYARQRDVKVTITEALDKMLNVPNVSPHLSQIGNWLKTLYAEASINLNPMSSAVSESIAKKEMARVNVDDKFANDALLLIRAVYLTGINIVNPEGKAGVPSELSAKDGISLKLEGDKDFGGISIRQKGGRCYVSFEPFKRSRIGSGFKTVELKDGESLLVGRGFKLTKLFGYEVDIRIPVACEVSYLGYSRGGIMICLDGDNVSIHDRGSRNSVSFATGGGLGGTYEPKSQYGDDGFTHGHTRFS